MRRFVEIVIVVGLSFIIGCSEDSSTNYVPDDRDRPPIPEPTYYSGPVSLKSVEMEVETVPLSDFTPRLTCASSAAPPEGYVPDSVYCIPQYDPPDTLGIYARRIQMMADDTVITAPVIGFFRGGLGNPWAWTECKPLSNQPYLQLVRYWVRIGAVERYSGSTSMTTTRTTTRGTTETTATEFTKTLGIETSVSGSWFVDFEVKIKTEFSWSESHETSIMQEESYEESFTITSPENQNIVYCVWQLVDEYRIVGIDGEDFTDPSYQFDPAYHMVICPTNELVPITTYFDSN